jgi:DNA topoisomerase-1
MSGLKPLLNHKTEEINAREVNTISLVHQNTNDNEPIVVRIGKFGPFLQQGERTGNIPEDLPPDELTPEKAAELLNNAQRAEEPLGFDPDSGKPVFVKSGRFGPYIQRGNSDDEEKQNASLLKGMTPETIDLETALKLLSLPRNLGKNPANAEDILARDGKFGPYIVCGKETRSLPEGVSPLEIELGQALELLAQPKFHGRRGTAKPTEPLKAFGDSPVTGKQVKLLSGRFGNYVTDGETNATLPKNITIEELTFDRAVDLLADRAAKGPAPKRPVRKKNVKKTVKKIEKKPEKKTAKKTTKK